MYVLGRWILTILFLAHNIDGVNREVLDPFSKNREFHKNPLSKDASKIINADRIPKKLDDSNSYLVDLELDNKFFRYKRSVSSDEETFCSPFDSCKSRCEQNPKVLPYTCQCDPLCHVFSDCCFDYDDHCDFEKYKQYIEDVPSIPPHRCELLFSKFNVLTANQCLSQYGDVNTNILCSVKMPKECVFSDNYNISDVEHVYNRCKATVINSCTISLAKKCSREVDPMCSLVIGKTCKKRASRVCRKCNTSFWPVYNDNGIIYRNSYCAECNLQTNYTVLSPHIFNRQLREIDSMNATEKQFLVARRCAPNAIDSCAVSKGNIEIESEVLCKSHSGPVVTRSGNRTTYKNIHCALCNGENMENLVCATKEYLMRGLIKPLLKNFIVGDEQGLQLDDIPAAFSILLNFGLDGRGRMYFSSECEEEMKRHQEKCGKGKIWDPFSEVCRKLYCSTQFVLIDYRCVRKDSQIPDEAIEHDNETSVIPDPRAESVHLTLSAEMELIDFLQFNDLDIETICDTLRESLANSFEISMERIRNVRFNISFGFFGGLNETLRFIEEMDDFHPITFKVDFDLFEDYASNVTVQEPSVDSIVSMLASSLSMDGFEFDINNRTSRIFEIHQTVTPLKSWCNAESGGVKKEYWNSEFSLIMDEENISLNTSQIKGIYVNKTGKFYPRGKFIADILFQGYQFSGNSINVSGVAIVCDANVELIETKPKLNESCIRILVNESEYVLYNNSLSIHNEKLRNVVDTSMYEEADNGSIWVCIINLHTDPNGGRFIIEYDVVQALVSYVLLWISVITTTVVILTYIAFPSLRNLPGCNTMNLTFSLLAMQLSFIFGQKNTVTGTACKFVGHLLHYEILCCFLWMNVMAYDLFRTFGNRNILSNIRSKRKFLPRYMCYAYIAPVSVIAIASLLDYYLPDSSFAPHYGFDNICWITSKHSAIAFFATPLAVIMAVNFVFFILTILAIRSVKTILNLNSQKTHQQGKSDVLLYSRMAFVIGLTWALSFVAAFVKADKLVGKILTYLFIIFNTLQGLFIFWIFVCNKRVYRLYRDAIRNAFINLSKHKKDKGTSSTIKRLANVMKRTISTDTVISTISSTSVSSNDSQLSAISETAETLKP